MLHTKPEYDYKHPIFKHRPYIRYAQEHKEMYETLHHSAVIHYEVEKTVDQDDRVTKLLHYINEHIAEPHLLKVEQLAKIFKIDNNELMALWLADKVFLLVENEDQALQALTIAEKELKSINSI